MEDSDGSALVMELVEGPTLADLNAGGRSETQGAGEGLGDAREARRGAGAPRGLKLEDALPIATQIVEALDAAHERGIIHRDLKPANIEVRDDGAVKILDFGLAKAVTQDPAPITQHESQSPTLTTPAMTEAGTILGTATYMSPEQAPGRPLDRRADIWAFGCVLYEMLTGTQKSASTDPPRGPTSPATVARSPWPSCSPAPLF